MKHFMYLIVSALLLSACSNNTSENEKTKVYTTVYPLEYVVEKVGGDEVDVESIIPPGADAHSYEPTIQEMTEYANGDAFVYIGGEMESFSNTISNSLNSQEIHLFEMSEIEDLFRSEHAHEDHDHGHNHSHSHSHSAHEDPHIWISPEKMIEVTSYVKDMLIEIDPNNEAQFNQNYESLVSELKELDQEFTDTLSDKTNGHIIVPHAAYGYWSKYGIEQIPVSGYSMSGEPSQQELLNLVETAREYDLKYVLFEQNADPNTMHIIQEEIGAESLTIHNLEVRTEDEILNDEDYIDIMRKNLDVLNKVTH